MMTRAGRATACCDAARSAGMGKYLRVIYLLSFKAPPVTTSDVAARLEVAPPSVSAMLRMPRQQQQPQYRSKEKSAAWGER